MGTVHPSHQDERLAVNLSANHRDAQMCMRHRLHTLLQNCVCQQILQWRGYAIRQLGILQQKPRSSPPFSTYSRTSTSHPESSRVEGKTRAVQACCHVAQCDFPLGHSVLQLTDHHHFFFIFFFFLHHSHNQIMIFFFFFFHFLIVGSIEYQINEKIHRPLGYTKCIPLY